MCIAKKKKIGALKVITAIAYIAHTQFYLYDIFNSFAYKPSNNVTFSHAEYSPRDMSLHNKSSDSQLVGGRHKQKREPKKKIKLIN